MSAETAGAVGLGIKAGLFAAIGAAVVTILAVAVGFTVVPLKKADELRDATRRLAAGLLASFTIGPMAGYQTIVWFPGWLDMWERLLHGAHPLVPAFMAATPAIAVCALAGFWIVAAFMRFFVTREDKDLAQIAADVRRQLGGGQ